LEKTKLVRMGVIGGVAVLASVVLVATSAGQQEVAPASATPASFSTPVMPSEAERMRLRDGFAAAENDDWTGLANLRDSATNPLVRHMLEWRWASATDAPLLFDDIRTALNDLQGWPGRVTMRTRAEQAIFDSHLSAQERIDFLRADNGPITGDGRVALALALRDAGQTSEADRIAHAAWAADTLTANASARADAAFSFSQSDYADRVSMLLWRDQRSEAQRLMSRLGPADRALAQARIAVQTRQRRHLQQVIDAVPASRADDPGLVYDRAQYRRRTNQPIDAMNLAATIDPTSAPAYARDDIFKERRLYVPRALRSGNSTLAYRLVSNHGLTSGESFADAEWLSGWISLRFLHNPQQAADHFAHLSERVSAPVSRSRALYWRAQAAAALGDTAGAEQMLTQAAAYPFTYYGQLAATRGNRSAMMDLPDTSRPSDAARNRFESRELVQALHLMAEVGAQRDFESIAYYLDDTLDDPQEIELLSQMAREQSYNRTALRSAKAGLFRNVVAANAAYPLIDLPSTVTDGGRIEPALVLSIIRQESEFDTGAVSGANAHGLMQLMPSTARAQARTEGMTYQRGALTTDPTYNITLGSSHLAGLIDQWGGSYVLAIASYNAGAFNAQSWVNDWGDPRSPSVDIVDWVELIPFSETRNYVQRVMENLQVYRYRLAGHPVAIQLEQDLNRGR